MAQPRCLLSLHAVIEPSERARGIARHSEVATQLFIAWNICLVFVIDYVSAYLMVVMPNLHPIVGLVRCISQ
jgi:hypothetical protein